jgi:hypothetical protein
LIERTPLTHNEKSRIYHFCLPGFTAERFAAGTENRCAFANVAASAARRIPSE